MEKDSKKVPVSLDSVTIGDTVYISDKDEATAYVVLDKGTPFILIENMRTHFANLYRPQVIYKML